MGNLTPANDACSSLSRGSRFSCRRAQVHTTTCSEYSVGWNGVSFNFFTASRTPVSDLDAFGDFHAAQRLPIFLTPGEVERSGKPRKAQRRGVLVLLDGRALRLQHLAELHPILDTVVKH